MTDCKDEEVIKLIIFKKQHSRYLEFGYYRANPWPKLVMTNNLNKWLKIEARQQKVNGQYKFELNFSSETELFVDNAESNFSFSIENPSTKRQLEFSLDPKNENKGKIRNLVFNTQVPDGDRNEQNIFGS